MKLKENTMNSSLPKLIVIEGVDAVGKTTIARMLEEAFGYTYLYTPQAPFNIIRNLVEEMEDIDTRFFYYLSSVISVQPRLKTLLSSGKKVVIDRYVHSTMAMHMALGAKVQSVNMRELPIVWPDVGILLTTRTDVRIKRMESRAKQPTHDKKIERFIKEAEEAETIYRSFNDLSQIDTTDITIDQVFAATVQLLRSTKC